MRPGAEKVNRQLRNARHAQATVAVVEIKGDRALQTLPLAWRGGDRGRSRHLSPVGGGVTPSPKVEYRSAQLSPPAATTVFSCKGGDGSTKHPGGAQHQGLTRRSGQPEVIEDSDDDLLHSLTPASAPVGIFGRGENTRCSEHDQKRDGGEPSYDDTSHKPSCSQLFAGRDRRAPSSCGCTGGGEKVTVPRAAAQK